MMSRLIVIRHASNVDYWLWMLWCCIIYLMLSMWFIFFFFSSRRRHTRFDCDWSSDVCSSDLFSSARRNNPPIPFSPLGGFNASVQEAQHRPGVRRFRRLCDDDLGYDIARRRPDRKSVV